MRTFFCFLSAFVFHSLKKNVCIHLGLFQNSIITNFLFIIQIFQGINQHYIHNILNFFSITFLPKVFFYPSKYTHSHHPTICNTSELEKTFLHCDIQHLQSLNILSLSLTSQINLIPSQSVFLSDNFQQPIFSYLLQHIYTKAEFIFDTSNCIQHGGEMLIFKRD